VWLFIAIVLVVAVVALLLAFAGPWGGGYSARRRVIVEREVPVYRERVREVPVREVPVERYPAEASRPEGVWRY
jgi:hypothetical protein